MRIFYILYNYFNLFLSTCYAHKLEKHLKICNARPSQPLPYISNGINAGVAKSNIINDTARCINNTDISDILHVISKINNVYKGI